MIDVSVQIHGLSDIEQALRDISNDDSIAGAKVIRSALMSASLPMYRHLQATAPESTRRPGHRASAKAAKGASWRFAPAFLKSRIRRRSYINKTGYGNRKHRRQRPGQSPRRCLCAVRPLCRNWAPNTHRRSRFIRSAIDSHWQSITQKLPHAAGKAAAVLPTPTSTTPCTLKKGCFNYLKNRHTHRLYLRPAAGSAAASRGLYADQRSCLYLCLCRGPDPRVPLSDRRLHPQIPANETTGASGSKSTAQPHRRPGRLSGPARTAGETPWTALKSTPNCTGRF